MNKQFVPYNIALELKELGFDEECCGFFNETFEKGKLQFSNVNNAENYNEYTHLISAPLWQQVEQWFRKKHQMLIIHNSTPVFDKIHPAKHQSAISILFQPFKWTTGKYYIGDTFEEAREEAILKVIELIKKKNL